MEVNGQSSLNPEAWAHQAFETIFSFVPTLVLKSALLLKIPDIIASASTGGGSGHASSSLSVHEIAARLPTENPHLDYLSRILRYLSARGVFLQSQPSDDGNPFEVRYALSETAKLLYVTEENPFSLVPFVLMHSEEVMQKPWHHLHECVLEGCPAFEKAHGKDLWAYARDDPHLNNVFNAAMASFGSILMKQVLTCYAGFEDVKTLVDVGGGNGAALAQIVKAYPHVRGINLDLPHVVATAPCNIAGVEHVGGDMFHCIPSADAIFIKIILHDWDDERCEKILENCYKALPENGKLILTEAILPNPSQSQPVQYSMEIVADLLMIAHTNGGRERSEQEWRRLLHKSAFHNFKIVDLPGIPVKIMESTKRLA